MELVWGLCHEMVEGSQAQSSSIAVKLGSWDAVVKLGCSCSAIVLDVYMSSKIWIKAAEVFLNFQNIICRSVVTGSG